MRRLALDLGNSRAKAGYFVDGVLQAKSIIEYGLSPEKELAQLITEYSLEEVVYLSVVDEKNILRRELSRIDLLIPVKRIDAFSPAPLANHYGTPQTLGADRFVAAVGAWSKLRPQNEHGTRGPLLVIDAGTALTYDYVNGQDYYLGGAISPGRLMRYRALNSYTANLPLLQPADDDIPLVGKSTEAAIHSGVENGILAEITELITRYQLLSPSILQVFITGGDAYLFEKHLKSFNFVTPDLVLEGLDYLASYASARSAHPA